MTRVARRMLAVALVLALVLAALPVTAGAAVRVQAYDTSGPSAPVRLTFIHHSTGGGWLADGYGDLGIDLRDAGYYVSDTNYGWGPGGIGDNTDVGHWWLWFRGPSAASYTSALYAGADNTVGFSRLTTSPGGPNEIVMFKSCFPNSNVGGAASDAVPAIGSNPLKGGSGPLTVGNAKGIYLDLLEYFRAHPEKLFVLIVSPPLRSADTNATNAANARYLANWLVDPNGWLKDYPLRNVVAFDYYTVLTGGSHTVSGGALVHTAGPTNYLAYPTGDSHPSAAGQQRATADFVPFLNAAYHDWKADGAVGVPSVCPTSPLHATAFGIAGALSSPHAGATMVSVRIERYVGGRWQLARTASVRVPPGGAAYRTRGALAVAGTYRVRAVHQCATHAPSYSAWRTLTVR